MPRQSTDSLRKGRVRLLRPEFFTDESVAECAVEARLFFMGLWCYADRQGRVADLPAMLRARIFPSDARDPETLLDDLACHGLISRIVLNGTRWIQIERWLYWQPGIDRIDHHHGIRGESASYVPTLLADPCAYCGRTDRPMSIDHIVPVSREGANHWSNLAGACRRCNTRKGAKQLLAFIATRPWEDKQ